jgi:hypothetical protein
MAATWLLLWVVFGQDWQPARLDVAFAVSAAAWNHNRIQLEALAWCESKLDPNPRRYGTKQRWGYPPLGRRWNICGIMQLSNGIEGKRMGLLPRCELQILFPELAVWYGAQHLAGWKTACGRYRQWDCYNQGGAGLTQGDWGKCVLNAAKKRGEKIHDRRAAP